MSIAVSLPATYQFGSILIISIALPISVRRTLLTRLALQMHSPDPERADLAKFPMPELQGGCGSGRGRRGST